MNWIEDQNGNRCSVEYFGTEEAAQKALDSLKECENCSDCSDCSGCSRCSGCSDCSNVAWLRGKGNLKGDPTSPWSGPPPTPKIESIHKKIYDAASIPPEALEVGNWHTCGTTHCRGGWAVHLAGESGYALEKFHGTLLAAQLIYRESGYPISPCRFFDSNEDALADMKRLAESDGSANGRQGAREEANG